MVNEKRCFFCVLFLLGMSLLVLIGGEFGLKVEQKHKAEVFKQNLKMAKKVSIHKNVKNYGDQAQGVTNDLALSDMISIQEHAIKKGITKQVTGHIQIPSIHCDLPIYCGANSDTLSLGAATYFYDDAEMGKGNYVLAGHNMEEPGVLFSDLLDVQKGDMMELTGIDHVYQYRVTNQFVVPEYYTLEDGFPVAGSFLALPESGEKPKLTLFTCIYTAQGKERYVVQGELI
ncbi:class A sortase [Enterococcus sp. ZJ1622]|uniref:class A sortase n=1 Tax=Enterococcus sp. ZJ1622 TaxID=2709401 RepID=UPI0013EDEA42|nr:class A sortase [Enterococcus sp. ZJ1622]